MKFCLVINKSKKKAIELLQEFILAISCRDCQHYFYEDKFEDGTDMVVVFGGDGTILNFVRKAKENNIPLLGVNGGYMGFLTEACAPIDELVDKIIDGYYTIDKRKLIKVVIGDESFYGLNEVVLGRADSINLVDIEVFVDGVTLDKYRADAVIVATPTGSTAYSLSAGGPVLSPRVAAIVVTPVCPHSLHSKAVVLSDLDKIQLCAKVAGTCLVVLDGIKIKAVKNSLSIDVSIDQQKFVPFVRINNHSFYKTMVNKFNGVNLNGKE